MKLLLLLGSVLSSLAFGGYTECPSEQSGAECESIHRPVCGIPIEGLPTTFQNSCEACRQHIKGYLPDACGSLLVSCSDSSRVDCTDASLKAKTSCGFQTKRLPVTFQEGACCQGHLFEQILVGWNCQGVELGNFVDRDPHLRSDHFNCPDIPAPVCATLTNGTLKTFHNSCDLHRSKVRFVEETQGACKQK